MSNTLLLNGDVEGAGLDEIQRLNDRIEELEAELRLARLQAANAKREATLAMGNLKKQLSPLYRALQMVFGELEAVGDDMQGGGGKWDVVKQRLAPRLREAVDLLLIQGSMKRTQMAAALKMDYSNCTKNVIGALLRQGLLTDDNGQLRLKEL